MSNPIAHVGQTPDGQDVYLHDDGGHYAWDADGGVAPVGHGENSAAGGGDTGPEDLVPGPKQPVKPADQIGTTPDGRPISKGPTGMLVWNPDGSFEPYTFPPGKPSKTTGSSPDPTPDELSALPERRVVLPVPKLPLPGPEPKTPNPAALDLPLLPMDHHLKMVGMRGIGPVPMGPDKTEPSPYDPNRNPTDYQDHSGGPSNGTRGMFMPSPRPDFTAGPASAPGDYHEVGKTPSGGIVLQHPDGTTWAYEGDNITPVSTGGSSPVGMLQSMTKGGTLRDDVGATSAPVTSADARTGASQQASQIRVPSERDSIGQDTPNLTWEQLAQPGGLNQWMGRTYNSVGRMTAEAPPEMQPQSNEPFVPGQGMLLQNDAPPDRSGWGAQSSPSSPQLAPQPRSSGAPAQPAGPDPFQQNADAGAKAIAGQTDAQVAAEKAKAGVYGQQVKDMEAQKQQMAQDNQRAQDQGAELFRRYTSAIDDAAQAKIDPEHWQKSRTGGQQIAATIGLALGSFAQAIGGTNAAAEQITAAVKRDVDAQAANMQQKNATVAARGSAIGLFLQMTGDKRLALAAYADYSLKQTIAKIDQVTADSASPITRANGEAAKVKLQSEVATNQMQYRKMSAEVAATNASATASYASARHMDAETRQVNTQADLRAKQLASGVLLPTQVMVNGQKYDVGDKGIAESLDKAGSVGQRIIDASREARAAAQEWGSSSNKTAAGARYAASLEVLTTLLNAGQGIEGVVGEQQRKTILDAIGNDHTRPSGAVVAGLDSLEHGARNYVSMAYKARGVPSPIGSVGANTKPLGSP